MSSAIRTSEEKIKYSKLLSSLFCLISTVALSMLCLFNNFTIDLYSAFTLLKVVFPASFCFYHIGFMIGKIFDNSTNSKLKKKVFKETKSQQAYEIPSMFGSQDDLGDSETGIL